MMLEQDPLQAARQAFESQGLPWPPLPGPLAARLRPQGEHVFATRTLPASPYEIERYVQEAVSAQALDDYAVTGFAGHGVNSWAAHCFIVQEPLALFIQVPWGGIYTDAPASLAQLQLLFAWAGRLITLAQACARSSHLWPGERLVVVASQMVTPGWGWVAAQDPGQKEKPVAWNPGTGMLAGVERALALRLAGEAPA